MPRRSHVDPMHAAVQTVHGRNWLKRSEIPHLHVGVTTLFGHSLTFFRATESARHRLLPAPDQPSGLNRIMQIKSPKRQSGAIFANLALGAAAVGSIAAVTTDWTAQQSALALQKQQGYLFATLNDAVGNYMTLLFPNLTETNTRGESLIPAECGNLPYQYGTSKATEPAILGDKCKLTVTLSPGKTFTIANAFQPTIPELQDMGILDRGITETPVLTTELVVAGPDSTGAASTTAAPNAYAIAISPICIGADDKPATCNKTNRALSSSVLNIQPFVESKYIQSFIPLMWAAGPDAAISGPPDASNVVVKTDRINPDGEFRSIQAGWKQNNPIQRTWSYTSSGGATATYSRGVDNLVLMRNGYNSAYWQLTRRDGSSRPTADWDFNNKNITNIGFLSAASANISGDLAVGGKQTVGGTLDVAGDSTFKGALNALGKMVVSGATELKGSLRVLGLAVFADNVTLEKNLQVKGNTSLEGTLTGTSANFTGGLDAKSLNIGGTQISENGTLLGTSAGWGVNPGDACSENLALAQSKDGKLQICRSNAWTALVTTENIISVAPGVGRTCSPEGSPGQLPDGTLAVCRNGQWETASPGMVTAGTDCSAEGMVSAGRVDFSPNLILLGCKGGKWTDNVFAKPKLGFVTIGNSCTMNDELAFDSRGYPSFAVCKNGKWQTPGTQLLTGMTLGGSCTLDGVIASDIEKTGLLICKNGTWSKLTDPVKLGGSCEPEGKKIMTQDGTPWFCVMAHEGNKWSKMPGTLPVYRNDRNRVILNRMVEFNGNYYYFYSTPGAGLAQLQSMSDIAYWLHPYTPGPEYITTYQYRTSSRNIYEGWTSALPPYDGPAGLHDSQSHCQTFEVQLPSTWELNQVTGHFAGRPRPWQFEFGSAEVWTATRRDECNDWGCDVSWAPAPPNRAWWDHATQEPWYWSGNIRNRWNSDYHGVILRVKKVFGSKFNSEDCATINP